MNMPKPRILIAYFSRKGMNYVGGRIVDLPVGNTEVAARMIQAHAGGDLFRIDTMKPYPADYTKTTEVAQRELREKARPALAGRVPDMAAYDIVILGYPNWWNTMPMAVNTFLEASDFAGKTILPFCTHEGSGLGRSEGDIRKLCPGAQVLKGLSIVGSEVQKAEAAVSAWLRTSGAIHAMP